MIRQSKECFKEIREGMRGGNGSVEITNFVNADELYNKGRLFGKITLNPGCGIGYHIHENESEIFYIIKGSAVYNDNGVGRVLKDGDVAICKDGQGHRIDNTSDSTVELVALIIKK